MDNAKNAAMKVMADVTKADVCLNNYLSRCKTFGWIKIWSNMFIWSLIQRGVAVNISELGASSRGPHPKLPQRALLRSLRSLHLLPKESGRRVLMGQSPRRLGSLISLSLTKSSWLGRVQWSSLADLHFDDLDRACWHVLLDTMSQYGRICSRGMSCEKCLNFASLALHTVGYHQLDFKPSKALLSKIFQLGNLLSRKLLGCHIPRRPDRPSCRCGGTAGFVLAGWAGNSAKWVIWIWSSWWNTSSSWRRSSKGFEDRIKLCIWVFLFTYIVIVLGGFMSGLLDSFMQLRHQLLLSSRCHQRLPGEWSR